MEINVGDTRTECLNPKTVCKSEVSNKGGSVKKRKNKKLMLISSFEDPKNSKKIKNSIDNDDASGSSKALGFDAFSLNASGDGYGVIIPKKPRGFVGRSRFANSNLVKPSDMVLDNKKSSSKTSTRKRKRLEPSNKIVTKKVESASKTGTLDDLEQNAARMLSSRFSPTCTNPTSKSTTSANVGSETPMAASDPASAEAADRESCFRKRLEREGTSKRRQYYEVHTFRLGAHWYLNRKIKIYWPLDKCWYHGRITDYDLRSNLHHVVHDDGNDEWVCLAEERFELLPPRKLPHKPITKDTIRSEDTHKKTASVHVQDETFMDTRMESEPLISWLTHRVNPSTSTSLKKQSCSSAFLDTSIYDRWKSEGKASSDSEDHVPLVYLRRRNRNRRFGNSDTSEGLLNLVTTALTECKKFEICTSFWLMFINIVLGTDMLWLLRRVFLLQYGTMVTMWSNVFLEVLFVDNIVGLRLFRFEGCLKKAVAFVLQVMKVFCEPEEDESVNQQVLGTSIRFKLSFFQNFRKHKVFSCCRFSKVRDINWKYLDSKFQPHCVFSRQLSLSECTYDNIKLLEAGTQHSLIPYAAQTASHEVSRKKSDHGAVLVPGSSGSSNHLPMRRRIYNLKHGTIPPLAISSTASPNFIFNQHLKRLLERGIIPIDDDDCSHEPVSSLEPAVLGVVCTRSHIGLNAAIDEVRRKSTTACISLEASGISAVNNRPSRQLGVIKESPTSNFKGISVEIPALSDGIICNKSSVYGNLWADGKMGFSGNGPKKPRTQVQYTLPKNKGNNQIGQPYQRIRKSKDKMTSSEIASAACEANLLIYGGNKGWRECGARVSLKPDQQNEWKLSVKCNGELRYAFKVSHDLQPGFTNRFTHAMIWKGGKDWGLEFPDRSQWVTFKEMHEECHNRNIQAASLKKIPIPGVGLVNDSVYEDMPCFNRGFWYMRQVGDDVEMAMDASHVMYDMDSEDEEWVCRKKQGVTCEDDKIADELFEKVMDMFEKVSYAQKRDHFASEEIDELIARVSPVQVARSIYDYWREKRQRKGIPLLRQLQPPLWEIYQQRCREWEKLKPKLTTGPLSGSREKGSTAEDKPPMFAFCLKPRGLELLNKSSKNRPHKKVSLSGLNHAFLGSPGSHHSSGKKNKGKKSVAPNKSVVGGSDLEEFRARDLVIAAKRARDMVKMKRERSRKLMLSADVAIHKAVSALMIAEAMNGPGTPGEDDPSTTS